MKKLAWHFDYHSHKSVRIGDKPDTCGIAGVLADAGVEEIITFAKCHTGFSYYPTKVGTPHPLMKGDPFGDLSQAVKSRNIKILAYVSFGIDGEAARKHPDYAQYYQPGKNGLAIPDHFVSVCPFTPYVDELFLPQIKEISELYRPDGYFFDTMNAFGVCYCEYCRQQFRAAYGMEIPETPDAPGWPECGKFRHDRAIKLIDRIGFYIETILPGAIIGFNQIGCPPFPEKMPACINRLTLDFNTRTPQSLQSSLSANYGSAGDIQSDVMPTRFNEGWGDWSAAPDLSLEQVSAPILAYNQRIYMGDRLHPQNRIMPGTVKAINVLHKLWQDMNEFMPPEEAVRQPDAVILHNQAAVYGANMETFGIDRREHLTPLQGLHRMMIDIGWNSVITPESCLGKWLNPDRLLILPEIPALSQESNRLIRDFVAAGGRALAVGKLPPDSAGYFGINLETTPWQDHFYLPAWESGADTEHVLVRGKIFRTVVDDAEALAYPFAPYDLTCGVKMGWGINPPADEPDDHPVLTVKSLGQGKAFYLNGLLFSDYHIGLNISQARWFEELLNRIANRPSVKLQSKAGGVEVIPYKQDNWTWYVLLNHGGEELSKANWPRTLAIPPRQIELRIKSERIIKSITLNGQPCVYSQKPQSLSIPVMMDTLWKIVKIEE